MDMVQPSALDLTIWNRGCIVSEPNNYKYFMAVHIFGSQYALTYARAMRLGYAFTYGGVGRGNFVVLQINGWWKKRR